MFPLCKTCADTLNQNPCTHADEERAILGTWCHVELMKAIEKGYEVLKIHEVWHWEYYEHEGIRLDPNKIEYNPGLRSLAKFAFNSLWGTYIMLFHDVNPR